MEVIVYGAHPLCKHTGRFLCNCILIKEVQQPALSHMICGLPWLGEGCYIHWTQQMFRGFTKRLLSSICQRGERFLGTVTRGGAYGKAGGQNPQVPVWSALNTQKGNLETRKVSGKRVRGTWRSGLPALGPGQERAPEALPEPAVFSVPALQLLKLLGGQHHPTVRLAVLRREITPRLWVGPRRARLWAAAPQTCPTAAWTLILRAGNRPPFHHGGRRSGSHAPAAEGGTAAGGAPPYESRGWQDGDAPVGRYTRRPYTCSGHSRAGAPGETGEV